MKLPPPSHKTTLSKLKQGVWIRHSEASYVRECVKVRLKGIWKFAHPIQAWHTYKFGRSASESRRCAHNKKLIKVRRNDPQLASLNEKQKAAVVTQEDRTLIVAGAGTGKTHTMVAKAFDTIQKGIAQSHQIAFVTFTKKATEEIRSRMRSVDGIEIGTLHHLARRVIAMVEGKEPSLTPLARERNKKQRLQYFEQWLIAAINEDPSLLIDLRLRENAFERCRTPSTDTLPRVRVPPHGALVKSMGEAQIALTLHFAGIPYQYEAQFPVPKTHRSISTRVYRPDFYIPANPHEQPDIHGGIWYEHFAHDNQGRLPAKWDEDKPGSTQRYEQVKRRKLKLHSALGTRFTSTTYGEIQDCFAQKRPFPEVVLDRLRKCGLAIEYTSDWDVAAELARLKDDQNPFGPWRITEEIDAWIRTYRQQIPKQSSVGVNAIDSDKIEEAGALERISQRVLKQYVEHMEKEGTVDHEGTILKAWKYLLERKLKPPWEVILVDEYQDVNPVQAAFVHSLLSLRDETDPSSGARLTAVGDDWQAIFGFQGGNVELIRKFNDPAHQNDRFHERIQLTQTYRFGQQLADSTRNFVIQSPGALDRKVIGLPDRKPNKRWPHSIVIASNKLTPKGKSKFGRTPGDYTGSVLAILSRIQEQVLQYGAEEQKGKPIEVLILARRNIDIGKGNGGYGDPCIDRKTINKFAEQNNLDTDYSTVHKAKGREADYVIMLDTGPPRAKEIAQNRALERAMVLFSVNDPAEEERRIWYVALTRAKYKVYVVADHVRDHTHFTDELYYNVKRYYDVGEDELAEYLCPLKPRVPCPACNHGILSVREGPHGNFASCTSFDYGRDRFCGHKERVCAICNEGLMVRREDSWAECQIKQCTYQAPLCNCEVSRPMIKRKNRRKRKFFWGCQNFSRSSGNQSCGLTLNWTSGPKKW